jgi:chemosensory pili system protein ChpA (sensor histidine kinase/response regulator)
VPVEEESHFDSLEFEQYNELHSCTHSFIESIADSRELTASIMGDLNVLDGMFVLQNRINKEFQQIVMSTRLVPAKTIIARLERIVRQTCRATEKQADFEMLGGEVLMDGEVLNKLTDPLMHILRNSVDHGMELPAERKLAGKPETGRVAVNVYPLGNNIVVRVEDNGKGLNYDKIRATAVERGLIKEGQEVTRAELARMIFIAGFSTKGGVTQISGRGVGMDVVHSAVLQLKGTVDIESEPGQGTAITLTLPTSLVTVHVLLVKLGPYRFALPTSHLEQALTPDSGEFRKVGGNISFHMDKNAYPVTTLSDLLNLPGEPVTEHEIRPLVLVREEGNITAVVVDGLMASRDLVSKTMGRYVKHIKGVSGASILGDGSVVALLDLPELLREPAQLLTPMSGGEAGAAAGAAGGIPHILIVDDSLSVRKSLSQLVEDSGYETLLAKDGLEAIEVVGQTKPTVMLVDMEMPRMNGIELTAHIRANEATKDIPIFMITSRTTEKHRQLAQEAGVSAYLTKPYQDTELLKLINDAVKRR